MKRPRRYRGLPCATKCVAGPPQGGLAVVAVVAAFEGARNRGPL